MLVLFTLDGGEREVKFPLRIEDNWSLLRAITYLRRLLRAADSVVFRAVSDKGIPFDVNLSIKKLTDQARKSDVSPQMDPSGGGEAAIVDAPFSMTNVLNVYVLLDGAPMYVNRTLLSALQARKAATTKHHASQQDAAVKGGFDPTGLEDSDEDGKDAAEMDDDVEQANGGHAGLAGLEDDPQYGQPSTTENLNRAPGLHIIKVNGRYQKAYSVGDVPWGGAVVSELPYTTVLYPTQMAEVVKENEKLRTRTYDPNFSAGPSTLNGVDDGDFSKYVSIARTYGHLVNTKDRFGAMVALYAELSSIRHSCSPNCIQRRALTRPYRAVIRCCTPNGLSAGEEVTVLFPKVNTVLFMLMPRERRQKALQERYHFTCDCSRCWKSSDECELSLSGAYFDDSIANNIVQQKRLTHTMRDEFDALNVIDSRPGGPVDTPVAARIPVSPTKLLDFVEKYSKQDAPLRLHRNHWRLSCVRRAYMKQVDFVLTAQRDSMKKVTPLRSILERRSIDVVLQQMATETVFIPPGHPFYVTSESIFRKILAVLPDKLCAVVQSKARKLDVDWTFMARAQLLWGVKVTPFRPPSADSTVSTATASMLGDDDSSDEEDEASRVEEAGGSSSGQAASKSASVSENHTAAATPTEAAAPHGDDTPPLAAQGGV